MFNVPIERKKILIYSEFYLFSPGNNLDGLYVDLFYYLDLSNKILKQMSLDDTEPILRYISKSP